jgi:Rod binding domain-containing protein
MADLSSPATISPNFLKPAPTANLGATATTLGARPDEATLRARAKDTAQKFEGQFLSIMMQQMFEGVKTDGPFGGGVGEEMFRSMMTEQMGKQMAQAGGIGLSDTIQREILKLQGLK